MSLTLTAEGRHNAFYAAFGLGSVFRLASGRKTLASKQAAAAPQNDARCSLFDRKRSRLLLRFASRTARPKRARVERRSGSYKSQHCFCASATPRSAR